jgi:hypothetical protein
MSGKLREALKQIEAYASGHGLWDIEVVAKTALAEPLKNYEVGTAEEQSNRFFAFCNKHQTFDGCSDCPLEGSDRCEIAWAQMPYESEVLNGYPII